MLFDTAMESYMGVTESLDAVIENWEGPEVEPSSRAFAEITREGAEELARLESAIYVADVVIESQLVDGDITMEQAEAVAEGAIKDFLGKIVKHLKALFEKVKGWFVSIGKKIKVYAMDNKKFVAQYENEIRDKAKSSELKIKSYKYDVDKAMRTLGEFEVVVLRNLETLCGAITSAQDAQSWMNVLKDEKKTAITVDANGNVKDTFWETCKLGNTWAEVKDKIMKDFHDGDAEERSVKDFNIEDMIKMLKAPKEEKAIKDFYNKVSSTYNRSIKDLEAAQRMYNDDKKSDEAGKERVGKFVKATSSKVSSLTSLYGNCGELSIAIYREYTTASAKICKALVTKRVKESYVGSYGEGTGSILESALGIL